MNILVYSDSHLLLLQVITKKKPGRFVFSKQNTISPGTLFILTTNSKIKIKSLFTFGSLKNCLYGSIVYFKSFGTPIE